MRCRYKTVFLIQYLGSEHGTASAPVSSGKHAQHEDDHQKIIHRTGAKIRHRDPDQGAKREECFEGVPYEGTKPRIAERQEEQNEEIVDRSGAEVGTDDPENAEDGDDRAQHFGSVGIFHVIADGKITAGEAIMDVVLVVVAARVSAAACGKRFGVVGYLAC